jgi:hypothetical protein
VNEAHIRRDLQRVNNEAGRQKNKAGCCLYLFPPPQEAGEGQIPGFPLKNAWRKNRRKFLHRNGQRGGGGIPPEY